MRVAFDHQIFTLQRYGGVSRYFVELFKSLLTQDECKPRIFAPLHYNALLKSLSPRAGIYLPHSSNFLGFNSAVFHASTFFSGVGIRNFNPDVLHETFYGEKNSYSINTPIVSTIHDLTRERLGVDVSKIERKKKAIERADRLITVSKSTTNDLIHFYGVDESKISTIYVGVSNFFRRRSEICSFPKNRKPFILFVGHRDGYKNWKSLISSYSKSNFLRDNFHVVCFGGNKFSAPELLFLRDRNVQNLVSHASGTDIDLRNLYQQASCLVYPSIYEGFGSPVIEAMASGCPVFCSGTSALLESGGAAAKFFDPNLDESIIDVLESGLNSHSEISKMVELGYEHSSQFTWERTASQTLRIYKDLAPN